MARSDPYSARRATLRVPRSKGALGGMLLVLLGVWAALIPFVGPYFDFGYTPDTTWTWNSARFWYEVLPGAATFAGGLLLLLSANRMVASLGAGAAAASGAWLVVGPVFASQLDIGTLGSPIDASGWVRTLESIGLFFGVGVVILYLAATSLGRMSVTGVRDVRAAERRRDSSHRAPSEEVQPRPVMEREEEPVVLPDEATTEGEATSRTEQLS